MKTLMFIGATILFHTSGINAQEKFMTRSGHISFFSEAPIADVNATNEKVKVEFNTSTNEVTFTMAMSDFQFENNKMGRDARDKYLETEKYKYAGFKGKIEGDINYDKPGAYPATATGKLKIHGVERDIKEKGTVTVGKDKITLQSKFQVSLKDYNIERPQILGKEMTQEDVQVKVEVTLSDGTSDAVTEKKG